MNEVSHLEKFIPKRGEKQIISENGVPVRITKNLDSEYHADKVTLGVGDMVRLGEIQEPSIREEARLLREIAALKNAVWEEAVAALRGQNPAFNTDAWDAVHTIEPMIEMILDADPARRAALEELEALRKKVHGTRFEFGNKSSEKDDLWVGKEGTLVYSIMTGEWPAENLKHAHVWKKDARGISEPDPVWEEKITVLRERMQRATRVADIHQVEVLPEYQGKGIAKALLDVALWELEHNEGGVEFTVARVASDNPDGAKMIAAFKAAGFDAFDAGQLQWDDATHWTLVVRENPNR